MFEMPFVNFDQMSALRRSILCVGPAEHQGGAPLSGQSVEGHAQLDANFDHDLKLGSYPKALRQLKRKGELEDTVEHRTSKYLNNMIEVDYGALKSNRWSV